MSHVLTDTPQSRVSTSVKQKPLDGSKNKIFRGALSCFLKVPCGVVNKDNYVHIQNLPHIFVSVPEAYKHGEFIFLSFAFHFFSILHCLHPCLLISLSELPNTIMKPSLGLWTVSPVSTRYKQNGDALIKNIAPWCH